MTQPLPWAACFNALQPFLWIYFLWYPVKTFPGTTQIQRISKRIQFYSLSSSTHLDMRTVEPKNIANRSFCQYLQWSWYLLVIWTIYFKYCMSAIILVTLGFNTHFLQAGLAEHDMKESWRIRGYINCKNYFQWQTFDLSRESQVWFGSKAEISPTVGQY